MKTAIAAIALLVFASTAHGQTVSCSNADSSVAFKFQINPNSNIQNQIESWGLFLVKGKWEGDTFYAKWGGREYANQLLISPKQIKLDEQIKIGKNSAGFNPNAIQHILYVMDRVSKTFTMNFSIYQNGQDVPKETRSGTCTEE